MNLLSALVPNTAVVVMVAFLTAVSTRVDAGTVIVPEAFQTVEGPGQAGTLGSVLRLQEVYHASQFPTGSITITELRFRRNAGAAPVQDPVITTIPDLELRLSTTTKAPGQLSINFASNWGADAAVVFQGALSISSTNTGASGGPNPFDVIIPLSTPFHYDASKGHLLLDIRNGAGSLLQSIDATDNGGTNASRVFAFGNPLEASFADSGADIVAFGYENPPATSLVVPVGFESTEAAGQAGTLGSVLRLQEVYLASQFPSGPITIHELRFRRNAGAAPVQGPVSTTITDLEVSLSTSTRAPGSLSAVFAENHGPDTTTVFTGALSVSSTSEAPTGSPNAFDIIIPCSVPFTYDPAQGNLLLDIRNGSGSQLNSVDATDNGGTNASRIFSFGNPLVAAFADSGADVIQLVYTTGSKERLVVPSAFVDREAEGQAGTLGFVLRLQEVYHASYFPTSSIAITELRFRRNGDPSLVQPPVSHTVANIDVTLSVTPRQPGSLSARFDDNFGPRRRVVFSGSLSIVSTNAETAGGSNPFDIVVPIAVPFIYDPAAGNLLVEVINHSGSLLKSVDASNQVDPRYSRAFSFGIPATAEYRDQGADVIQFVYTDPLPVVVAQPQGVQSSWGTTATFSVEASGVGTLRYQWRLNGIDIPGATSATYSIAAVQPSDAGSYTVVIHANNGSTVSNPAVLTYTDAAALRLTVHPSLTVFGTPGRSYDISYTTNREAPLVWSSLGSILITNSPQVFVDLQSPVDGQRIYRVLLIP